jgi:nuclear pore complex protein Nup98-Nup96
MDGAPHRPSPQSLSPRRLSPEQLRAKREQSLTSSQNSGAFGSTQNNAFGTKPGGFGTTTTTSGGSLFGSGTATAGSTGFGGFGSSAPAATSSPFGASNTGGGLFGGNKSTFGGTPTPSNPFSGGTTSSPFGGAAGAFGSPASTALGGPLGECQGTGSVPFQATVEKEPNSNTNQQNSFQSISFQLPYQKFSPEELRLADYAQGRRFGNGSNQAGAFGASNFGSSFGSSNQNTTGGFGATNTGTGSSLFGGGASSSPFGSSQPQTTGFGSNTATSGGIFGAKPAGGLFGAQPQTQPSTGLFGSTGTTGGFGSTATGGFGTNNATTGSSLFGSTNNTANKPAPAFSFGTSQPASTGTGFGGTATTGFGGGGLFGNAGQQQNTSSPFGGAQQQPAAGNTFSGFGSTPQQQAGTSSLFGNTNSQQKPAGSLFGAPAATGTGGLFGSTQPAANNNPFGTSTNTQNTGGLFGAKPAGTGLFGAPNPTQNNTGGSSLFGNFGNQNQNQNQQNTGGLFSGLNNNNQPKPTLFSQPQQQPGSSMFGNTGAQQQGGLFGSQNNAQQPQQQPQNSLFGGSSLFGNSQQNQQTPQCLTTSISDNAAFGTASLFSNLASTQVNNPGPIATPLSSSAKQKKTAPLPMYKLNPPSASRFTTPQKRGFGFSYSTYGTPGSASSTSSTPGTFSNSALGGTFGRGLSKSVSTSSLHRSFNTEEGILAPGAFSASPSARYYGSTGSMKKLVINRSIRTDLFSPPNPPSQQAPSTPTQGGILKKRVSFDSSTVTSGTSSPLKQVHNNAEPSSEKLGYMRPRPSTNGKENIITTPPSEMEQVPKGNELAIVHEEEVSAPAGSKDQPKVVSIEDQEPGRYWMKPTKEEIENMNRVQRQAVSNFTIGREGIGKVTFNAPVDLTNINLDELLGNIVQLTIRSCTVYPEIAKKPPMGKGLNVHSTISLQNSWPRGRDKRTPTGEKARPRVKKHIDRLRKVADTNFLGYDGDTGIWTFTVEHFTTYGLPEYDDETDGECVSEFGQSTLSAPPDTPTPKLRTPKSHHLDESFASTSHVSRTESDPEDTFEFRKKKILPGAFDDQALYEDDEIMEDEYDHHDQESFLDERSVGSPSENGVEEPMDQDDVFQEDESVSVVDQEMAGSFPQADNTAEHYEEDSQDEEGMDIAEETPGAIMRARMRAMKNSETPLKRKFMADNDWTKTLKVTISPQKQDRALLKSLIDVHGNDSQPDAEPTSMARRIVSDGRGFATSIDLMNSLFGQTRSPLKAAKVPAKPKGFEVGLPSCI